jgi:uncharacterized protein YwqG
MSLRMPARRQRSHGKARCTHGAGDGVEVLWDDGGVANFLIRRQDLRKLDFSKVVYYRDNR